MKNKGNIMGLIVLLTIISVLIAFPLRNYTSTLLFKINNYLPNNLYVNNIHFGGKTLVQATEELGKMEEEQLGKSITITCDDGLNYRRNMDFTYSQLGYYGDKTPIIEQLNSIMDQNISIINRFLHYRDIERSRLDCQLSFGIHYDKFLKALEIFDNSTLKAPVDAKYVISKGKIEIAPEQNGFVFDKEGLYKELQGNKDIKLAKLKVKAAKPSTTVDTLRTQGIKELISSFTTNFDLGNAPRSSNIRLAASYIAGTILPPGAIFSFNDVVGQRTEEKGFQEAGVYINGKVDTGIGGGICQVSTTLYNSVLLADLLVMERSNHSLTVPYVPLSRDAAVSWGSQDFKFSNNTENYILINSRTSGGSITFELYSTKSNKRVELISTTLAKNKAPVQYIDDLVAPFGKETVVDKGHDGYQSQLVKNVYLDGKRISTEVVSKDKYLTAIKIIKRGLKIPDTILSIDDES